VVLVLVALVTVDVIDQARGCGSVDPTDAANSEAVVRNDSSQPVMLLDCQGTYCTEPVPIEPGSTAAIQAGCAASGSDMTSYRVTARNGDELGYIAVDTPRKQDGITYDVSSASRNRETPTPSH
jgi:hypothetical protein